MDRIVWFKSLQKVQKSCISNFILFYYVSFVFIDYFVNMIYQLTCSTKNMKCYLKSIVTYARLTQ